MKHSRQICKQDTDDMKKKKKHTHTTIQQWPGDYLLHRCCNYAEKMSVQHDITVTELYSHDCGTLESSFVSLTTNMLHNLFLTQ